MTTDFGSALTSYFTYLSRSDAHPLREFSLLVHLAAETTKFRRPTAPLRILGFEVVGSVLLWRATFSSAYEVPQQ